MTNGATAVATMVPGQLTVCTYGGFAPVCYKNPAGQLIGLDVSFLTRFAESLGLAILTFEKPRTCAMSPAPASCGVTIGRRLLERRVLSGRTVAAGPANYGITVTLHSIPCAYSATTLTNLFRPPIKGSCRMASQAN
jgi:ABC-type amino acid transport substrate-binding protein